MTYISQSELEIDESPEVVEGDSMGLAPISSAPVPDIVGPTTAPSQELEELRWLAVRISKPANPLCPKAMWGKPEAVMTAIIMGKELGMSPMQSIQRVHVFDGRVVLAAETILGLVRRAGHSVTFDKRTAEECVVVGKRRDGDSLTVTFSMADATKAGLTKKDVWTKYPRQMLSARAATELARALFSDCIGWAVYAPEDFDEIVE